MKDDELRRMFGGLGDIFTPDPFSPNPSGEEVIGQILIGKVRQTDVPFGLNLEELKEHTLITGRSGSGKTTIIYLIMLQLLQRGIPFLAFDFKQDYRHLLKYKTDVHVFNWQNLKFNPLRPPTGCDPVIWMQAFTNVFAQAYWLRAGSKGLIQQHIKKLYTDYGVFEGKEAYPSLHDLLQSVEKHVLERKYGREAGFMESTKNRVDECIVPLSKMFDCGKGFPIEDLLDKTVVFEFDGLLSENQIFLATIILRFIFQYRISNKHYGPLRHVIFFDEAKMVYDKKRDFISDLGINEVAQFTSQIREFGEGLVVADQMPIMLSDSIKSNIYTTICMSQSGGKNIHDMCLALHLTKQEQILAMKQLVSDKNELVFEAIVNMNGRWPTPFIIHIIPFQVEKSVTDDEVRLKMLPLIEQLNKKLIPRTEYKEILDAKRQEVQEQRKEYAEQKERFEGNILIKILTNIRDHPFVDQKARIAMLDLGSSSSTTDKYFKELIAKGFVQKHMIGLGKGQSTKVFYEITDKGAEFARMDKVDIPGKGDFKHKFWQHTIKDFFESLGYNAEIEKRYGGIKNVDVGFEMNGRKTAVEVELSADHLIENIQKDSEAGCETIIIAVSNQRSIAFYKKKIRFYNKDFLDKVEFRVLTDFLS